MLTLKKSFFFIVIFLMLVGLPTFAFADEYCGGCEAGNSFCSDARFAEQTNDQEESYDVPSYDESYKYHLGIGLRGFGFYQSPIRLKDDCLKMNFMGGVGWYVKGRFNRYISLDFENDFLYGTYKDYDGSMLKASASLGLMGHFLNYGAWDFYVTVLAQVTSVFLIDGGRASTYKMSAAEETFFICGGQFGLGLSYAFEAFPSAELGLDVRYIIEQAPRYSVFDTVNRDKDIHGVMFSLRIGVAV